MTAKLLRGISHRGFRSVLAGRGAIFTAGLLSVLFILGAALGWGQARAGDRGVETFAETHPAAQLQIKSKGGSKPRRAARKAGRAVRKTSENLLGFSIELSSEISTEISTQMTTFTTEGSDTMLLETEGDFEGAEEPGDSPVPREEEREAFYRQQVFVAENYPSLVEDISRGKGEHISALCSLMGCDDEGKDWLITKAQAELAENLDPLATESNRNMLLDKLLGTARSDNYSRLRCPYIFLGPFGYSRN